MFNIVNTKVLLYMTLFLLEETLAKYNECTGQRVTTYRKKMVKGNLDNPREFALDKGLNMLYFSHGIDGQLGQVHLGTGNLTNIESVESRTQTVNQVTHEVYIVPETKIYKYNPKAKEIDILVEEPVNVAAMFFYNSTLYFTERYLEHVHKLTEDTIELARDIQMQKHDYFVIDHNGTLFYTFEDQIHSVDVTGTKVTYYETIGRMYKGLAIDDDGNVIACTYYGIFQLNTEDDTLEHIVTGTTRSCSGIAIDMNNNIIYSDGKSVFKLKKVTKCMEPDKSMKKHRPSPNITVIPVHNLHWALYMKE